jgi:hypothetical protein
LVVPEFKGVCSLTSRCPVDTASTNCMIVYVPVDGNARRELFCLLRAEGILAAK